MTTSIGIDLGTSYTCAGFMKKSNFQIIERASSRETLNYVAFKNNGREIGENLKLKIRMNYKNIVFDSKVFIGSMFNEKLLINPQKYPFKIKPDDNNKFQFELDQDNIFYPEEITAIVLNNIKECAEKQIGNNVENAVISVPASFNDSQRQSTIDAAKIAGFKTIRLLNDTTAAAIAYVYDKNLESKKKIMIFDLGGHYLNLSIVNIENGIVEVQSAVSYPGLGGQTFDYQIADYFVNKIKKVSNKNFLQNMKAFQSLLVECEKTKKNLSNSLESFLDISSFFEDDEDLSFKLTRDSFEKLNQNLFNEIKNHVDDFIVDLKLKISDIDEVIIIGGSSRIPKLQSMLSEIFDGKKLNYTMNASETVVYGTSIQAAFLTGSKLKYNNGFKYVDLVNNNYCLKIWHNQNEELFDIFMPSKTQLETTQFASIKKALLKDKFIMELKENSNTIYKKDFESSHLNQFDVKLNIDINGIASINLVVYALNNIPKTGKIMLNKVNCITNDKIEKLKDNHINYLKQINEKNKKLALKNKFETKCYDLINRIKTEQKSGKYSEIEKNINSVLAHLNSSDKVELVEVNDFISVIIENFYKLNFRFEFEAKLKAIEIKYHDLKNEIATKDELKSGVYSAIEKDLDKFLENTKMKHETHLIEVESFLSERFEKTFRDKNKNKQELLMNDENFGEYSNVEKEIDIILENLISDLQKELIDAEGCFNSKKNDVIDLQHKAKLMSEINTDFEVIISSIESSQNLENELQNKDYVENPELSVDKTLIAIEIQASQILDYLKNNDNFISYFKNIEKGLSELLNDLKKKDSICTKSLVERLKKLKLEFLLIKEQTNIENRILKNIGSMFDSWYSKFKFVSMDFVADLFKIIKMRENNNISIDSFCQSIEYCINQKIGSFNINAKNLDILKHNVKFYLNDYKKSLL